MTGPDLMMDERRQLYLLYARYMGVSMGVSISRIEEEHDRVVAMWDSKDATRDKAERAGDFGYVFETTARTEQEGTRDD